MDDITKMSLVEKNLISPEFALNKSETGSILINDEENICIMIGGKDHINIQVINCRLDLENTLNLAIEIDKKIEDIFKENGKNIGKIQVRYFGEKVQNNFDIIIQEGVQNAKE